MWSYEIVLATLTVSSKLYVKVVLKKIYIFLGTRIKTYLLKNFVLELAKILIDTEVQF